MGPPRSLRLNRSYMADLLSRVSHMMALPPSLSGRMPPSAAVAFVLRPDQIEYLNALRLVVKHIGWAWPRAHGLVPIVGSTLFTCHPTTKNHEARSVYAGRGLGSTRARITWWLHVRADGRKAWRATPFLHDSSSSVGHCVSSPLTTIKSVTIACVALLRADC